MKVEYLLSDHLGSTSLTTDSAGTKVSEMRYKPFGEVRSWWTSSTVTTPSYALTKYTLRHAQGTAFTGQYSYMDDPSTSAVTEGFGLMHYGARMYDPALGRFTSADTIVPGGVQGYDRYAYVNNSPVNYVDPSGHEPKYGCYASTNGTCTNANGTPLSPGNGKGGRKEKAEGEEEGDPDLCEMVGECISENTNNEECDGSGLIAQFCLDMDAEGAQQLEDFLDNASEFLNIAGYIELSSARLYPFGD